MAKLIYSAIYSTTLTTASTARTRIEPHFTPTPWPR